MTESRTPAADAPSATGGLAEPLFDVARDAPERVLLARKGPGGWRDVTAAAFAAEVTALARGIVAAGVEPGDRVALLAENSYEWTLADYAVWSAGAVSVPVYPSSSEGQIRWILSDSGARACLVDTRERADQVEAVRSDLPDLAHVWCVADDAVARLSSATETGDDEVRRRRADVRPGDPATIVYTSGTTGAPKGCVLTHANFVAEVDGILADLPELFDPDPAGRRPRTLLFLPLAHVFGRMVQVCAIRAGLCLGHTASVRSLLDDLAAFRPTFLLAVPYVLEKVHANARRQAGGGLKGRVFEAADAAAVAYSEALDSAGGPTPRQRLLHRVYDRLVYRRIRDALGGDATRAITGGGALDPRLLHFFRGVGLEVIEGYGLTETTAAVVANRPGRVRPGTVGTPLTGAEIRLADNGELHVRGTQTFARYWNNEEATAAAFSDGWFATGDIGAFDDEGNLRIIGRSKEILVTNGGKNVVPGPLEERIREHPLVHQCMVLGDGRPFVTALVTLDPDARAEWGGADGDLDAEIQQAVDAANRDVSKAESVRRFTILPSAFTEDDETLTPTLKLRRKAILERYSADIERMYAKR